MKDQKELSFSSPEPVNYSQESDMAVRAVQLACSLCQRVQNSLISYTRNEVQSKDDNSLSLLQFQTLPSVPLPSGVLSPSTISLVE
ncbi:PAP-specific phosphatase HAL2-like isoform X1 [Prunus yedoensis var. nudiflora]|uniref:PAP-specific phosphatase HAL2-like isoform X1 n=1 Tax=Prunus yedoensis var. nudiflora TaxID=2094558 RepID=A0A314Y9R4_PRUYE|nr:PAP-specific phosphatase HAL2-like isoform X1 [Prunus yedoensis var. nudiflora]